MNIINLDQLISMTSKEIAELTGKRHDNVIRDVRKMLDEIYPDGGLLSFEDTYVNTQNGETYSMYRLDRKHTFILVAGYSVQLRAMSDGKGLIEIGELARGLGKRPDNVKRKLERIFPEDHLLNLRKRYKASIGKGASREIETYMLDYKTAGALAMSYDGMLGIEVLTILEDSLSTIQAMTIEAAKDNSAGVLKAAAGFRERYRERLEFRPGASENEDRSVALKRLGRKGL